MTLLAPTYDRFPGVSIAEDRRFDLIEGDTATMDAALAAVQALHDRLRALQSELHDASASNEIDTFLDRLDENAGDLRVARDDIGRGE